MNLPKIEVLGIKFNYAPEKDITDFLMKYDYSNSNYICFPSTDTLALADKNSTLKTILNNTLLTLIDGKVTEVIARLKGKKAKVVSAYNLLDSLLQSNLSHYFYGLGEKDLEVFKSKINKKYPNANILGFKSPPFIGLEEIQNNKVINADFEEIKSLKPNIVWLGISTPKQDYIAYYNHNSLDKGLIICIGAVFLYMADLVNPGPKWVKNLGVKWLYRLAQEPRRLWKHTVTTTFDFFKLLVKRIFIK